MDETYSVHVYSQYLMCSRFYEESTAIINEYAMLKKCFIALVLTTFSHKILNLEVSTVTNIGYHPECKRMSTTSIFKRFTLRKKQTVCHIDSIISP